jgi:hypothetical protein
MVEQQIAFVKRDLPRIPLLPVPVLHGFLSVEAEPLLALSTHLQSLDFQVGEPKQRSYTDGIGFQHSFHGLFATHENTVDFVHLHAAAVCAAELAEKFGVVYDSFFIDVAALRSDA